jgi:hypothetical protein
MYDDHLSPLLFPNNVTDKSNIKSHTILATPPCRVTLSRPLSAPKRSAPVSHFACSDVFRQHATRTCRRSCRSSSAAVACAVNEPTYSGCLKLLAVSSWKKLRLTLSFVCVTCVLHFKSFNFYSGYAYVAGVLYR